MKYVILILALLFSGIASAQIGLPPPPYAKHAIVNNGAPSSCKEFMADWSTECLDFGPGNLTQAQKKQRLHQCVDYAVTVSYEMDRYHRGAVTKKDMLESNRMMNSILRVCLLEGREHFPTDQQVHDMMSRMFSKPYP